MTDRHPDFQPVAVNSRGEAGAEYDPRFDVLVVERRRFDVKTAVCYVVITPDEIATSDVTTCEDREEAFDVVQTARTRYYRACGHDQDAWFVGADHKIERLSYTPDGWEIG